MNRSEAIDNVTKALDGLFAVRPKIDVPDAKRILEKVKRDIDIMLINIEWMQENFGEFRDKH